MDFAGVGFDSPDFHSFLEKDKIALKLGVRYGGRVRSNLTFIVICILTYISIGSGRRWKKKVQKGMHWMGESGGALGIRGAMSNVEDSTVLSD